MYRDIAAVSSLIYTYYMPSGDLSSRCKEYMERYNKTCNPNMNKNQYFTVNPSRLIFILNKSIAITWKNKYNIMI